MADGGKAMALTLARLDADGLLAPERKRARPASATLARTSPDGAGIQDVMPSAQAYRSLSFFTVRSSS